MMKIRITGTSCQVEKMLMELITEWDNLERWALKYYSSNEKALLAASEKERLMQKLMEVREANAEG